MALLFLRSRSRLSWKSSRFIYSVCLKFVRSRMVFLRLSCQIANSRYFWGISDFHIIGNFGCFAVSGRFDRLGSPGRFVRGHSPGGRRLQSNEPLRTGVDRRRRSGVPSQYYPGHHAYNPQKTSYLQAKQRMCAFAYNA